jgi:glycosyltransferase involved in cell wall biosynthesis
MVFAVERPMTVRVAIAYNFNDSDWFGGRNYFASLIRAATACSAPGEFVFVLVVGEETQTTLPDEFPDLQVARTPLMDRMSLPWLTRQIDLRLLNRDRRLARHLRQHHVDILTHCMHLGPAPGVKTLGWLYDFQFLHLPQYWKPKHIRWIRQWYTAACKYCDGVVVSSESALADLRGFAPAGGATRHLLRFVSNPIDFDRLATAEVLRKRYALPNSYFYLPNQFWSNKNHRLAIDALRLLNERDVEATIVCTGKPYDGRQPGYFDELMRYCDNAGVRERFRVLGIIPYLDTQGLMAHARAVINPSRFEGWSTTVEEAKTLQKDLFLSDIAVHREQAALRGAFFPVDDAGELAALMAQALARPAPPSTREAVERDYERRFRVFGDEYVGLLRELQRRPSPT